MSLEQIDREMERVASGIGIPPCPAILLELVAEARKPEPDFRKIERKVSQDVALAATLLKTVNSPFFGLRNKVSSVGHAVSLLGLPALTRTISGLVLRQVFGPEQVSMERFWDNSAKSARVAAALAKTFLGINGETAFTFGLFKDCAIALLMRRFPDYKETLALANQSADRGFTDIEDERHQTDHALLGYVLTKSWHLPEEISTAVRHHHDYALLVGATPLLPPRSQALVALGLLADHLVSISTGKSLSMEWVKGGREVMVHLGISEQEASELGDQVSDALAQTG